MKILQNLAFCWLLLYMLTGCQLVQAQTFPDAEIVYQAGDPGQKQVGFINADGSNPVMRRVQNSFLKPFWAYDGNQIYGLVRSGQYLSMGYPGYWSSSGKLKKCRNWFNFAQIEDSHSAGALRTTVISDSHRVLLVDLESCNTTEVLLDFYDHMELVIYGVSYSPEEQWLLYGLETNEGIYNQTYQLMSLNLSTGKTAELANGIDPAWSPDGTKIAYIQADGIYVMNADGSQDRRLVEHSFINPNDGKFGVYPPVPRWSPDGKWLVYHRCDDYDCIIFENTIYKVDIDTGKEQMIIYGGGYPDWKK